MVNQRYLYASMAPRKLLRRASRHGGGRRQGFQLNEFREHILPTSLIFFCLDRGGGIGIKLQDVIPEFWRRQIKFPIGQLRQQLGIGFVGKRIFGCFGGQAGIKIGVREHECRCALVRERRGIDRWSC